MNTIDPILFHSRHDPEAPAICTPGFDLVTYGRLAQSMSHVTRRARAAGLAPGHMVALFVPQHPILHAVLILGLARLGVITTSVTERKLPNSLRFEAILSNGPHPHVEIKTIAVDESWLTAGGEPLDIDFAPDQDDVCRIILTSGSTGEPKPVALTHRMMLGRVLRFHTLCGSKFPSAARLFCDVTLSTALGYTLFTYTLLKGGAFFMRGSAEDILPALAFHRVNSLVAHPRSLPGLLAEYDKHRCQYVFDVILTVGGILTSQIAERVSSCMGSNLIACYGSTETALVANAPAHAIRGLPGAVGYVTPGMTIEIVDEADRPLPPGESGLVRIRGEYMADGYFNEPEASAQMFRNGWFYPGDIGLLTNDGILTISGRKNAMLNLGGEKIAPEAIEEVVSRFDVGIAAGATLLMTDGGREQICVAIESNASIDSARLRDHCRRHLQPMFMPKQFLVIDQLPRNAMGKLDRDRLQQMMQLGSEQPQSSAIIAEPLDADRTVL